jgi:hypothetical protein
MDILNDWLAVGAATVAGMAVGAAWYASPLFGHAWRRLADLGPDAPSRKGLAYGGALVCTAVTAALLEAATATASEAWGTPPLPTALTVAAALWVGVAAARPAINVLFEERPWRLYLINAGHDLAVLLVMAVIIGLLGN